MDTDKEKSKVSVKGINLKNPLDKVIKMYKINN